MSLRVALVVFIVLRVALSLWAGLILLFNPLIVSNLDLFGEKLVVAFDTQTGQRAVFSRLVDQRELIFHPAPPNLIDVETDSVWDLHGRGLSGTLAGAQLPSSSRTVEEVFPYRGVAIETGPLLAPWQRFDANWYLKIAQRGYSADDGSTVYFPLYPILIRLIGNGLLRNDLLAAILISNLALIGAFYLLYQISVEQFDAASAVRAVAYLAIFPTAFFWVAPYTESLFLFLALASLREASRARLNRATIFAALAALARLQGVLLVVPLAYLSFRDWRNGRRSPNDSSRSEFHVPPVMSLLTRYSLLLLVPLATIFFLLYQYFFVGHATLVGAYESQLDARFVSPWENLGASLALVIDGKARTMDPLNLVITVVFGLMLIPIWRKMPRAFALYAALMFLAPLFRMTTTQPLVSMSRYALTLFPVFMLWGAWGKRAWVNRAIVYPSFALSLFLGAQFFLWGWVG